MDSAGRTKALEQFMGKLKRNVAMGQYAWFEELFEVLLKEPDAVKQQQMIEMLMAAHIMRIGQRHEYVLQGMVKHALQMAGVK